MPCPFVNHGPARPARVDARRAATLPCVLLAAVALGGCATTSGARGGAADADRHGVHFAARDAVFGYVRQQREG